METDDLIKLLLVIIFFILLWAGIEAFFPEEESCVPSFTQACTPENDIPPDFTELEEMLEFGEEFIGTVDLKRERIKPTEPKTGRAVLYDKNN